MKSRLERLGLLRVIINFQVEKQEACISNAALSFVLFPDGSFFWLSQNITRSKLSFEANYKGTSRETLSQIIRPTHRGGMIAGRVHGWWRKLICLVHSVSLNKSYSFTDATHHPENQQQKFFNNQMKL